MRADTAKPIHESRRGASAFATIVFAGKMHPGTLPDKTLWLLVLAWEKRRSRSNIPAAHTQSSVRHSCDHSARIRAGTKSDAHLNKPRCAKRAAISSGGIILTSPPQMGSAVVSADSASAKSPKHPFR